MRLISIVLLCLMVCACASGPKQYTLKVNIQASDNINPNLQGVPSPVEIRIYELTDDQAFMQSSFISLFENDQEILKQALLLKRTFIGIEPGSMQTHKIPLVEKTRFVAVLGGFADYQQAGNKKMTAITVKKKVVLNIFIDGTYITVPKKD